MPNESVNRSSVGSFLVVGTAGESTQGPHLGDVFVYSVYPGDSQRNCNTLIAYGALMVLVI